MRLSLLLSWSLFAISFLSPRAFAAVQLGNETLAAGGFRELQGKRIGLITNPSGVNRRGERTLDILRKAPGVKLVALFAPEHGIDGLTRAGNNFSGTIHPASGLPVHSLYGATRKPTPAMLKGLDVLVYDLQDTGCRSYTFISTLGLAMEACAESNIQFIVLDRPNPLGGMRIEGPVLDPAFRSFVGQFEIPYIYGLTCGELARMINDEKWIAKQCNLTVIPLRDWTRTMSWRDTGLRWIATSPNIPRISSALGYSAVGVFGEIAGSSGITIGTGFQRPFECIAATWLNAEQLSRTLNATKLPGLQFVPFQTRFRDQAYQGVELVFTDPSIAPFYAVNFHLLDAIRQTSSRDLLADATHAHKDFTMFDKVNGTDRIRLALASGRSTADLVRSWKSDEQRFRARRQPYLLYPEPIVTVRPPTGHSTPAATPSAPSTRQSAVSPGEPSSPPASAGYYLVTIRRGDTLAKIAEDLKVTVSEIVEANPGLDAGRIRIGQKIKVPRGR